MNTSYKTTNNYACIFGKAVFGFLLWKKQFMGKIFMKFPYPKKKSNIFVGRPYIAHNIMNLMGNSYF